MAKVKLFNAIDDHAYWADFFEDALPPSTKAAKKFEFDNTNGDTITIEGKNFKYNGDTPIAGKVGAITISNGGTTLIEITGLNVYLDDLAAYIFGFDREDSSPQDPDPFNAMSLLFMGDDKFIGSKHGDDMIAGRSLGDDVIKGKGGDDFIKGDAGDDKIDGGSGWDRLTYMESFYDPSALSGITLDVKKGTVKDSWGGKDKIKNFESFEGSKFKDKMKGSGADEEFGGLRGNDTIDGKGGFDSVYYDSDGRYGGTGGIDANLKTGKIVDGWGNKDTVKNIEAVIGTSKDDTFLGNSDSNYFAGLDGVDEFNGKGGFDTLSFHDFQGVGIGDVVLDLEISGAEIQDDGFGNVESVKNIEEFVGDYGNDEMLGDSEGNDFHGNDGDDTLNGRGGNDLLFGGDGSDQFNFDLAGDADADVIDDFEVGTDLIGLSISAFGLTGSVGDPLAASEFVIGNNAVTTDQRIIYNDNNGKLFHDADGSAGGSGKELIAELNGTPTLTVADFELIA
ncbi:calcium-binding protein [Bauldia sp.]|uniref:calcium-binding protein n=1 Tax=Bauldia sp. TaxID=2575872 RepID=UPI003BABCDD1